MRKPVVADRFYPGSPEELTKVITDLFPIDDMVTRKKALAIVSPHAGYVYSGALAARTIHHVKIPKTVILLGPNHTGQGGAVALSADKWDMVLGQITVDEAFNTLLLQNSNLFQIDERAHRSEHSIEVQLPFLQILQKDLKIVPIILSHISYDHCRELANALACAINTFDEDTLIVASSDMNHFESRNISHKKDRLALEKIEQLDPEGLYNTVIHNNISMCGMIPVVITLLTAKILGAKKSHLIDYTDSGDVSGDTSQVVGYAGVILY